MCEKPTNLRFVDFWSSYLCNLVAWLCRLEFYTPIQLSALTTELPTSNLIIYDILNMTKLMKKCNYTLNVILLQLYFSAFVVLNLLFYKVLQFTIYLSSFTQPWIFATKIWTLKIWNFVRNYTRQVMLLYSSNSSIIFCQSAFSYEDRYS